MECVLSGNQIKCLNRALVCFAKIGNELLIQGLSDKLELRTLNSSRSAFLSIIFKVQFFDAYQISGGRVHCSVLLKSACAVFRTSPGNMDRLTILLPDQTANKLQWILECPNGVRKIYGICCNAVQDARDVQVDRTAMPSRLVVKPRDLTRLLGHFQSSLQEITFIATEPISTPTGSETNEAKALEMRSYIDPADEATDTALHTQLWTDPNEELQEYVHMGIATDVTFSVKELKAFVAFCEGSEVDLHMYFQHAGYPVVLAPKFGLDDTAHADFDATLVLATCQGTQIRRPEGSQQPVASTHSAEQSERNGRTNAQSSGQRNVGSRASTPGSCRDSERTRIWSDLTGSAGRTSEQEVRARTNPAQGVDSLDATEEIPVRHQRGNISNRPTNNSASQARAATVPNGNDMATLHTQHYATIQTEPGRGPCPAPTTQIPPAEGRPVTQEHASILAKSTSNWVSGDVQEDDDDDANEDNYGVESTPPHRRGLY